ncbi:MAG: YbaB/EbfC family nucleoid-associated protein [Candidatus Uhrbacteria bacterium]
MFSKIKAIKDIRDQAKNMQSALEEVVCTGTGGKEKVRITMNGNQRILSIDIDDELMTNKPALSQALIEAFGNVTKDLQKEMAGKMKEMGGLQDMIKSLGM